jgi:hypothetical protein
MLRDRPRPAGRLPRRRVVLGGAATLGTIALGGPFLVRGVEDAVDEAAWLPEKLRRTALDLHVHALGVGTGGTGCRMRTCAGASTRARDSGPWAQPRSTRSPSGARPQPAHAHSQRRLPQARRPARARLDAHGPRRARRGAHAFLHGPTATWRSWRGNTRRSCSAHRSIALASTRSMRWIARPPMGAVPVKWIPNVQRSRLTDPRCCAFCRRLAHLRMALLPHVGDEQAPFVADHAYGNLRTLVAPLAEDAPVMVAHAASTVVDPAVAPATNGVTSSRNGGSQQLYARLELGLDRVAGRRARATHARISSGSRTCCCGGRYVLTLDTRCASRGACGACVSTRASCKLFLGRIGIARWWHAWVRENALRRDFDIKRAIGLPDEILTRGNPVLAPAFAGATAGTRTPTR